MDNYTLDICNMLLLGLALDSELTGAQLLTHPDTTPSKKGKGHPITGHEGPTGGVEV
jgi:hypothetical protein